MAVSNSSKLRIRKGDTVVVISGAERGTKGEVLRVIPRDGKVVVKGVRMVSRHTKPNQKNQAGGIIRREAPIPVSKVMYWDSSKEEATRLRSGEKNGKRVRVSVRSGNAVDA